MSYAAKELSVQSSAPAMLFLIVQGGTTWRLTTSATDITKLAQTWTATAMTCSSFSQSGEMPKETITLKLPIDHSLAITFLGYSPDVVTSVTVYRTHTDDADALVYWKGRVATASLAGNFVALECEPIFTSLRRMGLTQTFQRTCRHALYGAGCMLQAADFDVAVTVTAVAGPVLTITEAGGLGYSLVGGTFKASDGTIRMITAHDGTTVTLMRWIKSLVAEMVANPGGFAATVYPGCDKSADTCRDTFDNLGNFGGFPGIPRTNPMGGGNAY